MKKHLTNMILVIILILGISLLLYPSISEYINAKHQTKIIQNYVSRTENMTKDERQHFIDEAREYNHQIFLTEHVFYQPGLVPGYKDTLDITGTGIMGYIEIDKLGVELPIYHTVDDDILQTAIGHLPGTSLPVGGEGTHAVLSGHRGLPSARLFTNLDEMEVGDHFRIVVLTQVYTYQVDRIKIVRPIDVDDLQIVPGQDYCTLMTCTPYGINSHRLLVRGVRVENEVEKEAVYVSNDAFLIDPIIVTPAVAAPMLLLLLIYMNVKQRLRIRRRRESEKGMEEDETE